MTVDELFVKASRRTLDAAVAYARARSPLTHAAFVELRRAAEELSVAQKALELAAKDEAG